MKLVINRSWLEVHPESPQDVAYILDTLKLNTHNDSVCLVLTVPEKHLRVDGDIGNCYLSSKSTEDDE